MRECYFAAALLLAGALPACGRPGALHGNGSGNEGPGSDAEGNGDGDPRSRADSGPWNPDPVEEGEAAWGVGTSNGFDPTSDNSNGVTTSSEGALVLDGNAASLDIIWIPSTNASTITKVDTRTRVIGGRYRTGPGGMQHLPSRTGVDAYGDVVVANRAFNQQPSVTKIQAGACPDTNADGDVTTSTGHGDILGWGEDDCVVWHSDVGDRNGIARAVAVVDHFGLDGVMDERVWIGLFEEYRFVELDRVDGEPTGREARFDRLKPYGAAVDRDKQVWAASYGTRVFGRFDSEDPDDTEEIDGYSYGITVDEEGYVWLGSTLRQYDPEAGAFVPLGRGEVNCYGVAADGMGHVWAADENDGRVHRVSRDEPGAVISVDLESRFGAAARPRGLAIDDAGMVWAFALNSTQAFLIDPATCDDGTCDVEPVLDDCPGGCLDGPYNYSDMTGLQLRNATNPLGTYEVVVNGCDGVDWGALTWDALTPDRTSVRFRVKTGTDVAALAAAPWIAVATAPPATPPVDVGDALEAAGVLQGRLLVIEATLSTETDASPVVRSFSVESACEPIFQ